MSLVVPLALSQQEIWDWLERWPQSTELFNDTFRITLPGPFDPSLVRRVLDYLVRRHEPLRTTFHQDEQGATYQSVAASLDLELDVVDLSELPPADQEPELARRIGEQHRRPIDITAGPLFFATLFKRASDSSELAFTIEHIISDQTTESILYSEVRDVHAAFLAGREPDLPTLPIQFADFALWQRQWLTDERLQEGCDYWRQRLRGMPATVVLPWDRAPDFDTDKRTGGIDFLVPGDVQAGLERLTKATRSTLYIVAVAAAQALLAQYTAQTDVVVLTTFHGRDRRELEGVLGLFAGVGLLRSDLGGDPTFEHVIGLAGDAVLGMIEHQYVPIDKVMEALIADLRAQGIEEVPRPAPFSVEFFHAPEERLLSGMSLVARRPRMEGHVSPDSPDIHDTINPLALRIFGGDRVWGRLSYHEAAFDRSTAARLVAEYKALLAAVAHNPGLRLSQLPPVQVPG